jgi:hypothetical protein
VQNEAEHTKRQKIEINLVIKQGTEQLIIRLIKTEYTGKPVEENTGFQY